MADRPDTFIFMNTRLDQPIHRLTNTTDPLLYIRILKSLEKVLREANRENQHFIKVQKT